MGAVYGYISVWVWVRGYMGVWEWFGRRVRVRGRIRVRVHGCDGMGGGTGVCVYGFFFGCMGVWMCGCECTGACVGECMGIWYMSAWV